MNLKRDLADAKFRRCLLVPKATHHERQYFSLARRKGRHAAMKFRALRAHCAPNAVLIDCRPYGRHERVLCERLGQKVDSATLHGAHTRGNVAASGDKDDWRMSVAGELLLELEPVDVGQLDIEDQARWQIGLRRCDIVPDGAEGLGLPPQGPQKLANGLAHSGVVVDNEDDLLAGIHDASSRILSTLRQ